jgi:acyl-CoA synthetase (AMP-forming)/AMP-acid ligase II
MVESGLADRVLLGEPDDRLTGEQLAQLARRGASTIREFSALVYVGENQPFLPVAFLAAACAGVPFVPVNYRLQDDQLNALIARQDGAYVLADRSTVERVRGGAVETYDGWLSRVRGGTDPTLGSVGDDDDVAIVLYTSGTTSEPKSALLRHRHVMAYLLGTVEFASAAEDEAALVAVPPYHVAGLANLLSNLFAGRRLVYLDRFEPQRWLEAVRTERITHAMVVPTMLARIVDALGGQRADVPTLRSLSYGGAKVSQRVVEQALRAMPDTAFVNAYGLTETASTISVLGPDDHRAGIESADPVIRRRLSSAGQILPSVEVEIRDDAGSTVQVGVSGTNFVRGEQIAGEYASGSALDADGWFWTRDHGSIDAGGYLFIEGRSDDTIIRGGENIAPSEIEDVLLAHPKVAEACVVGVPDDEWGQRIVAVVVPRAGARPDASEVRDFVRERLRGSKTPAEIVFRKALPHTDTGKLLRRIVAVGLTDTP